MNENEELKSKIRTLEAELAEAKTMTGKAIADWQTERDKSYELRREVEAHKLDAAAHLRHMQSWREQAMALREALACYAHLNMVRSPGDLNTLAPIASDALAAFDQFVKESEK